jgi:hypothetical protein
MPRQRDLPPPPPDAFLVLHPSATQAIAQELRQVVRTALPDVTEAVRVGWSLIGYRVKHGRKDAYFGFIAPQSDRVPLGFEYGYLMTDPYGLIGGDGKQVKTITIRDVSEIQPEPLMALIHEAVRVAMLSPAERRWLAEARWEN